MKVFELKIPAEFLDYINKEIKKPKRPNTELLELWLERELAIENKGTYGNLPVDESHVTIKLCTNNIYEMVISDGIFKMITATVQPEPHSHKISNEDILHFWLEMRLNRLHSKEHIEVREITNK